MAGQWGPYPPWSLRNRNWNHTASAGQTTQSKERMQNILVSSSNHTAVSCQGLPPRKPSESQEVGASGKCSFQESVLCHSKQKKGTEESECPGKRLMMGVAHIVVTSFLPMLGNIQAQGDYAWVASAILLMAKLVTLEVIEGCGLWPVLAWL